jgi:hypothetical protein
LGVLRRVVSRCDASSERREGKGIKQSLLAEPSAIAPSGASLRCGATRRSAVHRDAKRRAARELNIHKPIHALRCDALRRTAMCRGAHSPRALLRPVILSGFSGSSSGIVWTSIFESSGLDSDKREPDYALSSAIKAWYKTGAYGCFCGFERWRATRCNFKRGSARPSLLFFTEQRISAGRR